MNKNFNVINTDKDGLNDDSTIKAYRKMRCDAYNRAEYILLDRLNETNAWMIYVELFGREGNSTFSYNEFRSTMSDEEITHAIEVLMARGYLIKNNNKEAFFRY